MVGKCQNCGGLSRVNRFAVFFVGIAVVVFQLEEARCLDIMCQIVEYFDGNNALDQAGLADEVPPLINHSAVGEDSKSVNGASLFTGATLEDNQVIRGGLAALNVWT